jgi:hypothetical protein
MKKFALSGLLLFLLWLGCEEEKPVQPVIKPITITSPSDNANVSGILTVRATVGEGYSIDEVDFYVDGGYAFNDSTDPFTYSWDVTVYDDSSEHRLYVIGYDNSTSYVSDTISVTVVRNVYRDPISITSPKNGATVYDTVNVLTTSGQGYSFYKVAFFVDSDSVATDSTAPFSYKWNTNVYSDNTQHTLRARAYDSTRTYLSNSVTVTVLRPVPVTITYPANNATVTGLVTVIASAGSGYVLDKVVFYVDNDSAYTDQSSPYEYEWDTSIYLNSSSHQLKAIAYYNATSYTSNIVNVTVVHETFSRLDYISTYSLSAPGSGIGVDNSRAYIALGSAGMQAIDVSIPTSIEQIFIYDSPGLAYGVDANSPDLILADGDNGVQLFDISDPDTVLVEGFYNTSGISKNVTVVNSMVYVADNDALQILSISGGNFVSQSRLAIGGGQVIDVDAIGSIVYVLDVTGVTVVNAANPSSPTILDNYNVFNGLCTSISATANYLFVGTTMELRMLDADPPSDLQWLATQSIQSGVTGVCAVGTALFVSQGGSDGGALLYDFSSGNSLTYRDDYINSDNCSDIAFADGYVFLLGQTKVDILQAD